MKIDKILHVVRNKKNLKKYPGISNYRECWFLIEPEYNYKENWIVAGVEDDGKFVYYDEYKDIRKNFRKHKLEKLRNV